MNKPELVLPGGTLEKLKTAILFGADAVYMGGKDFSLRAYAGNLTMNEMEEGLKYAHTREKRVYVTANILAHNYDIRKLPSYLEQLEELGVDGLIISDAGVIQLAKKYAPGIPITVSTQANISNYEAAAFYRDIGAKRIVLARELSLAEIADIKSRVDIDIEVFVHGAMCVSYSGRCLLSHYMTGRSANSGACTQPCRYRYALVEEQRPGQYYPIDEDERGAYILNSRDLCLLEYIPALIDTGINAFKVEGRMKSPLYVATVARIYKQAVNYYLNTGKSFNGEKIKEWMDELNKVATRPFTNGFVEGESELLQDIEREESQGRADFCGIVTGYHQDKKMIEIEQRANFGAGDKLELMLTDGSIIPLEIKVIYDVKGQELDRARHPRQAIFVPFSSEVEGNSILRRVE